MLSDGQNVWLPEMIATSITLVTYKNCTAKENSNKGKYVEEFSIIREYTPIYPHNVIGKSIDEMMDYLKESIQ